MECGCLLPQTIALRVELRGQLLSKPTRFFSTAAASVQIYLPTLRDRLFRIRDMLQIIPGSVAGINNISCSERDACFFKTFFIYITQQGDTRERHSPHGVAPNRTQNRDQTDLRSSSDGAIWKFSTPRLDESALQYAVVKPVCRDFWLPR